jgi:anti-sigma B factor antagonist
VTLVVVHAHNDQADVLSLVGDVDLATAPRLVTCAADVLREGANTLVLDLREVQFMDSAGLAALLNVLRRATAADAELILAELQPQVSRLLADTRMDRQFTVVASVEQVPAPDPASGHRRGAR